MTTRTRLYEGLIRVDMAGDGSLTFDAHQKMITENLGPDGKVLPGQAFVGMPEPISAPGLLAIVGSEVPAAVAERDAARAAKAAAEEAAAAAIEARDAAHSAAMQELAAAHATALAVKQAEVDALTAQAEVDREAYEASLIDQAALLGQEKADALAAAAAEHASALAAKDAALAEKDATLAQQADAHAEALAAKDTERAAAVAAKEAERAALQARIDELTAPSPRVVVYGYQFDAALDQFPSLSAPTDTTRTLGDDFDAFKASLPRSVRARLGAPQFYRDDAQLNQLAVLWGAQFGKTEEQVQSLLDAIFAAAKTIP